MVHTPALTCTHTRTYAHYAGKSYVCDVNGWSFVKNSYKYYDDTAILLREFMLSKLAPSMLSPQLEGGR